MARLGDVGKVITGNTPKTSEPQNYASNDICFVKPSDIVDGTVTYLKASEFYISEYARAKARVLPPKSVLVTCIGIIGKVAINDVECAFNQQINAIIPDKSKCLTEYLAYAIQNIQAEMQDIANAPVVPILNKTQFSDIEIKLPTLIEQSEIVEKLNAVSKLIALRKEQLAKLDQLVKSRFIELSNEWECEAEPLQEFLDDITYGFTSPMPDAEEGPWKITAKDVINGKINFDTARKTTLQAFEELTAKSKPDIGTVLLTKDGTLGRCAVVEESGLCVNQSVAVLKCNKRIIPKFLAMLLQMPDYQKEMLKNAGGGTIKHIYITKVVDMLVMVPDISRQLEFLTFVEQTDKSKLAIQQSLDKLELLKKSLMQEYFG